MAPISPLFHFPFSMFVSVLTGEIDLVAVALAFVQFPSYVWTVSNFKRLKTKLLVVMLILTVHLAFAFWTAQNKGEMF